MIFFSIFNLNPRFVIMKAPKHLLNVSGVTTCRNGVKIYHVKNAKWTCGQVLEQYYFS